jgi:hypothetical protein
MHNKTTSLLLLILVSLLSSAFLRCEREDLYEISAAKFRFSSELKAQYFIPDGGTAIYSDVPYTGVNWGNVAVTPAPISFQLVNTASSDITIIEFGINQSDLSPFTYTSPPASILVGTASAAFDINFAATASGSYSAQLYVRYTTVANPDNEQEISFTLKAVKPAISGGLVAQWDPGTGYENVTSGGVNVGSATMPSSVSRTVRLLNTSTEMIMASTPTVTNGVFTVSAVTGISAGSYADVTVTLTSAIAGPYNGTVIIQYVFNSAPANYKSLTFLVYGTIN